MQFTLPLMLWVVVSVLVIIVGIGLALAVVVRRPVRLNQLGVVSQHWIAEHNVDES